MMIMVMVAVTVMVIMVMILTFWMKRLKFTELDAR